MRHTVTSMGLRTVNDQDKADKKSDARRWARRWSDLADQRLEAAKRGESSPWLGMKQWLYEIPLDASLQGFDPLATKNIERREAEFQRAMQEASQNPKSKVKSPWPGVHQVDVPDIQF